MGRLRHNPAKILYSPKKTSQAMVQSLPITHNNISALPVTERLLSICLNVKGPLTIRSSSGQLWGCGTHLALLAKGAGIQLPGHVASMTKPLLANQSSAQKHRLPSYWSSTYLSTCTLMCFQTAQPSAQPVIKITSSRFLLCLQREETVKQKPKAQNEICVCDSCLVLPAFLALRSNVQQGGVLCDLHWNRLP